MPPERRENPSHKTTRDWKLVIKASTSNSSLWLTLHHLDTRNKHPHERKLCTAPCQTTDDTEHHLRLTRTSTSKREKPTESSSFLGLTTQQSTKRLFPALEQTVPLSRTCIQPSTFCLERPPPSHTTDLFSSPHLRGFAYIQYPSVCGDGAPPSTISCRISWQTS